MMFSKFSTIFANRLAFEEKIILYYFDLNQYCLHIFYISIQHYSTHYHIHHRFKILTLNKLLQLAMLSVITLMMVSNLFIQILILISMTSYNF